MKSHSPLPLFSAAVGAAALLLSFGCSRSDDSVTTVQSARPDGSTATVVISDTNVDASGGWDRIKDFTFDRRADFSAGIDRMSKDMDDRTATFRARVAGAPDAASKERDGAMKEFDDARADLKSKRMDLDNATANTWADAKAKTSESLKKTKATYDKVAKANPAS
jgi:hypothetical protein